MSKVAYLLVSCCLEQTRADIFSEVVKNLSEQAPGLLKVATVFDNASTMINIEGLGLRFSNVYQANRNVGYWTAIDWWLRSLEVDPPDYTYIIESDMIHYRFSALDGCVRYLDANPNTGAVRLHEYSVADRRLYDKDNPLPESKRYAWRSHTNHVTGAKVKLAQAAEPWSEIYETNFLTHLPALNRYKAMASAFGALRNMEKFSELDFQKAYHAVHPMIAILDGGIFHDRPGSFGAPTVTGSWTPQKELQRIGYQNTRYATIVPADQYTVTCLR